MGWLHWMVCRKCIQWYMFVLKLNHISYWVRLLIHEVSRLATVDRTPLDEWSARHRDLYLTKHNTHNKRPCSRWDSNPRHRRASGSRPTTKTVRPMGPTTVLKLEEFLRSITIRKFSSKTDNEPNIWLSKASPNLDYTYTFRTIN